MQNHSTAEDQAVTMTAACEVFGRHAGTGPRACSGTILSLTDAHGSPCTCSCHGAPVVRDLPAAFAEMVFLTPPCDQDVDLALPDDDELDDLLAEEADRRNDELAIGRWSW